MSAEEFDPVAGLLIRTPDWRHINKEKLAESYRSVPASKPDKVYPLSPINKFIIELVNGCNKTFSTEDIWRAANLHFEKKHKRTYIADRIYHLRKKNYFERIGYDTYKSIKRTTT
jgi:hypothetical protein